MSTLGADNESARLLIEAAEREFARRGLSQDRLEPARLATKDDPKMALMRLRMLFDECFNERLLHRSEIEWIFDDAEERSVDDDVLPTAVTDAISREWEALDRDLAFYEEHGRANRREPGIDE